MRSVDHDSQEDQALSVIVKGGVCSSFSTSCCLLKLCWSLFTFMWLTTILNLWFMPFLRFLTILSTFDVVFVCCCILLYTFMSFTFIVVFFFLLSLLIIISMVFKSSCRIVVVFSVNFVYHFKCHCRILCSWVKMVY